MMVVKKTALRRKRMILVLAVLENIKYQCCVWLKPDTSPGHVAILWTWLQEEQREYPQIGWFQDIKIATIDLSLVGCMEYLHTSWLHDEIEAEMAGRSYRTPVFESMVELEIVHFLIATLDWLMDIINGWSIPDYLHHPTWQDVLTLAHGTLEEFVVVRGFATEPSIQYCDCKWEVAAARTWVQQQADECRQFVKSDEK